MVELFAVLVATIAIIAFTSVTFLVIFAITSIIRCMFEESTERIFNWFKGKK